MICSIMMLFNYWNYDIELGDILEINTITGKMTKVGSIYQFAFPTYITAHPHNFYRNSTNDIIVPTDDIVIHGKTSDTVVYVLKLNFVIWRYVQRIAQGNAKDQIYIVTSLYHTISKIKFESMKFRRCFEPCTDLYMITIVPMHPSTQIVNFNECYFPSK